eukprot:TRINITY_DN61545_c0_g1_i4.p1 TRINITY_DN61545_c0_g1~~TRINITY_DN61545_c0_g1_i4.p1  ORF type:complete len:797 (+),score=125.82 TRINITY_DN61545_c0_g1_i4:161-2551(+)
MHEILYPAPKINWYGSIDRHPSLVDETNQQGLQQPLVKALEAVTASTSPTHASAAANDDAVAVAARPAAKKASAKPLVVCVASAQGMGAPLGADDDEAVSFYVSAYYQGEAPLAAEQRRSEPCEASANAMRGDRYNCVLNRRVALPYNSRQQFVKVALFQHSEKQAGDAALVGEATVPIADPSVAEVSPWTLMRDFSDRGTLMLSVLLPGSEIEPTTPQAQLASGEKVPRSVASDASARSARSAGRPSPVSGAPNQDCQDGSPMPAIAVGASRALGSTASAGSNGILSQHGTPVPAGLTSQVEAPSANGIPGQRRPTSYSGTTSISDVSSLSPTHRVPASASTMALASRCQPGCNVEVFSRTAGRWVSGSVMAVAGDRVSVQYGSRRNHICLRAPDLHQYFRLPDSDSSPHSDEHRSQGPPSLPTSPPSREAPPEYPPMTDRPRLLPDRTAPTAFAASAVASTLNGLCGMDYFAAPVDGLRQGSLGCLRATSEISGQNASDSEAAAEPHKVSGRMMMLQDFLDPISRSCSTISSPSQAPRTLPASADHQVQPQLSQLQQPPLPLLLQQQQQQQQQLRLLWRHLHRHVAAPAGLQASSAASPRRATCAPAPLANGLSRSAAWTAPCQADRCRPCQPQGYVPPRWRPDECRSAQHRLWPSDVECGSSPAGAIVPSKAALSRGQCLGLASQLRQLPPRDDHLQSGPPLGQQHPATAAPTPVQLSAIHRLGGLLPAATCQRRRQPSSTPRRSCRPNPPSSARVPPGLYQRTAVRECGLLLGRGSAHARRRECLRPMAPSA